MSGFHAVENIMRGLVTDSAVQGVLISALGVVFLWAGVSKLTRPHGPALALAEFGITRAPSVGAARGLGAFEVALGLALVSRFGLPWALTLASVVLWTFASVLGWSLMRGKTAPCYCFGTSEPLSFANVTRTAGLAIVATTITLTYVPTRLSFAFELLQLVSAIALVGVCMLIASTALLFRTLHSAREVANDSR